MLKSIIYFSHQYSLLPKRSGDHMLPRIYCKSCNALFSMVAQGYKQYSICFQYKKPPDLPHPIIRTLWFIILPYLLLFLLPHLLLSYQIIYSMVPTPNSDLILNYHCLTLQIQNQINLYF